MMRNRTFATSRTFGRRAIPLDGTLGVAVGSRPVALNDDLKLFLYTFVGGFLFMTVYLA